MNKLDEIQAFVLVVDAQSFTQASEKSDIAKSMLSRRISSLESRLGVQLLHRTTRRLALTDSGRDFYQRAIQILADIDEAEQSVADINCEIGGKIRLAAPLGLGEHLAIPIADFMSRHEAIEIDVDLNDRQIDLIEDNRDLAIRIGDLEDSTLIARRLTSVNMAICASPKYLEEFGEPTHPSELAQHEVAVYSNSTLSRQWHLEADGVKVPVRPKHRLSANNGTLLAKVASQGLLISAGPMFFYKDLVDDGQLKTILTQYTPRAVGMYAVYPPGRLVSLRVKMLSNFLFDYYQQQSI